MKSSKISLKSCSIPNPTPRFQNCPPSSKQPFVVKTNAEKVKKDCLKKQSQARRIVFVKIVTIETPTEHPTTKLGNKTKVRSEADQTNDWVKQAQIAKRLLQGKMTTKRPTL